MTITVAEAALLASADPQCSPMERDILHTINGLADPDRAVAAGHISYTTLAQVLRRPRPDIARAVVHLEELRYLPEGCIR